MLRLSEEPYMDMSKTYVCIPLENVMSVTLNENTSTVMRPKKKVCSYYMSATE